MTKEQIIEQIMDEFISKFCNNHGGEIRFLRQVFYDEKDGAEQIITFLESSLSKIAEASIEAVKLEKRSFYTSDWNEINAIIEDSWQVAVLDQQEKINKFME